MLLTSNWWNRFLSPDRTHSGLQPEFFLGCHGWLWVRQFQVFNASNPLKTYCHYYIVVELLSLITKLLLNGSTGRNGSYCVISKYHHTNTMKIIEIFPIKNLYQTFLGEQFCYFTKRRPSRLLIYSQDYWNKPTAKIEYFVLWKKKKNKISSR